MGCKGCGRKLPNHGRVVVAKKPPDQMALVVVLGYSGPLVGEATKTDYGTVAQGQVLRVHLDDMQANRHLVRATQEALKIARALQ